MTAHDITEDRVATLHSLLNDAAKKVGEQRQRIAALETALKLITEMDGDQPARSDWDMVRIARSALGDAA